MQPDRRPTWTLVYLVGIGVAAAGAIFFGVRNALDGSLGGFEDLRWLLLLLLVFPCLACAISPARGWMIRVNQVGRGSCFLIIVSLIMEGLAHPSWFPDSIFQMIWPVWAMAMVLGLAALLRFLPPNMKRVRVVAIGAGILASGGMAINNRQSGLHFSQAIVVSMTILLIAIALSLPAAMRYWPNAASKSSAGRTKITIGCPRCGKLQQITCPDGKCSDCRLAIHVEVDEPLCKCGYLLFGLSSDICPECGADVNGRVWPAPMPLAGVNEE